MTRPKGEQRAKPGQRRGGSADAEREAKFLANAQKQLGYYAREADMLQKKMVRA